MSTGTALVVVEPGIATTIQDPGRHGLAHLGIPPAGAVDPSLAGLLNRLVGNRTDAAVIETVGNLVLEARSPVTVATSRHGAPVALGRGERVAIAIGGGRQWHYVAVRGGIASRPVLGSRSHDTLSGLGAAPVVNGTGLAIGGEPNDPIADIAPIAPVGDEARIGPGPRVDWFGGEPLRALTAGPLTVGASSRVGVRLRGAVLVRVRSEELPSEGLVRGAIQVPPDGDPIMMLADHPTTGGYPVVAVVHPDDVATVAQHPEGTAIRFRL
jgi:biotin-dependent carboxylase-like uncharacterized protein